METTFISIHDLSLDARLLYVSRSIEDVLGYSCSEVIGKSCWEYFHPDEIPFAQSIHGRSIQLDKASVLNYCQIKNKDGRWVGCECVFTIVHDVLVASTSVYRRGPNSQKRAVEAPVVRQLFSSSPRDPRYHMLSYISHKFSQETRTHTNEPRAALFLNRFSRTLAIMYATNGLADLLGVTADQLTGKSFYYCIQENCLREAVKCLESAKANDSIAYLRFWFRDPTQDSQPDCDERMSDGHSSGDDDDGGVVISEMMDEGNENAVYSDSSNSLRSSAEPRPGYTNNFDPNSRSSSGNSTDMDGGSNEAIFDQPTGAPSSTSSISTPDHDPQISRQPWEPDIPQIELEAVVSCTSDGLVVVLRRARPFIPHITQPEPAKTAYANGFFASPWANDPIVPDIELRSKPLPDAMQPNRFPIHPTAAQANTAATHGPASEDFMNSIREVAVFAWSLTGINGSLAKYGRGTPSGESQPPDGLPVWDPNANVEHQIQHPPKYVPTGPNGFRYSSIDGAPLERLAPIREPHANARRQDHVPCNDQNTTNPPSNDYFRPTQYADYDFQAQNSIHQHEVQQDEDGMTGLEQDSGRATDYRAMSSDFHIDHQQSMRDDRAPSAMKQLHSSSQSFDGPDRGQVKGHSYRGSAFQQPAHVATTDQYAHMPGPYQQPVIQNGQYANNPNHSETNLEHQGYGPNSYQDATLPAIAEDSHPGSRWNAYNMPQPAVNVYGHT